MTRPIVIWLLLNCYFIPGCTYSLEASNPGEHIYGSELAIPSESATPYGVDGSLNAGEISAVMSLVYPQNYNSIANRFGFPAYRDEFRDYYQIENTDHWLAIDYDGDRALGYRISN